MSTCAASQQQKQAFGKISLQEGLFRNGKLLTRRVAAFVDSSSESVDAGRLRQVAVSGAAVAAAFPVRPPAGHNITDVKTLQLSVVSLLHRESQAVGMGV